MALIISVLTAVASVVATVVTIVRRSVELKQALASLRSCKTIVGVVNVSKLPDPLMKYRDFSDIKKAVNCSESVVVLHCRTLSYALQHCDFVCASLGNDNKIHTPDDDFWFNFSEPLK